MQQLLMFDQKIKLNKELLKEPLQLILMEGLLIGLEHCCLIKENMLFMEVKE
jgi:hypothetical protein